MFEASDEFLVAQQHYRFFSMRRVTSRSTHQSAEPTEPNVSTGPRNHARIWGTACLQKSRTLFCSCWLLQKESSHSVMDVSRPLRDMIPRYFPTGAKLRRVAGWVAGGCWDDEIDS